MEVLNNSLEAVKEWLNDLTDDEILNLHNEYCEKVNYMDDSIYDNGEVFFEVFFTSTDEAVRAVSNNRHYNYNDKYVIFDGQGNLESSDYTKELIDIDELAQYIYENPEEFEIELEEDDEDYLNSLMHGVDNNQ